VAPALLTDVDELGPGADVVQKIVVRQLVVDDDICLSQQLHSLDGHQAGISGTGPNEIGLSGHDLAPHRRTQQVHDPVQLRSHITQWHHLVDVNDVITGTSRNRTDDPQLAPVDGCPHPYRY